MFEQELKELIVRYKTEDVEQLLELTTILEDALWTLDEEIDLKIGEANQKED